MSAALEPAALDELQRASMAERRIEARRMLGFGRSDGDAADRVPLRAELKRSNVSVYPVAALGALGIVGSFQSYAFTVLTPTVMHSLGLSLGAIALARTLAFISQTIAPVPMAALARRGRRAALCLVSAAAWSAITLLTG